jgi:hypothetical protein
VGALGLLASRADNRSAIGLGSGLESPVADLAVLVLVAVHEPPAEEHEGQYVGESGDGCPGQLDVAGLEVGVKEPSRVSRGQRTITLRAMAKATA